MSDTNKKKQHSYRGFTITAVYACDYYHDPCWWWQAERLYPPYKTSSSDATFATAEQAQEAAQRVVDDIVGNEMWESVDHLQSELIRAGVQLAQLVAATSTDEQAAELARSITTMNDELRIRLTLFS